jgi:ribonuclease P protein component
MIGQLVHSSDFQRLLSTRPWSRSAHFAIHHLPARPGADPGQAPTVAESDLSTSLWDKSAKPVDDFAGQHWLGAVLPKRLARRAVTRNLLRRQIRAAMLRHQAHLPGGLWVVRLRQGFARTEYVSAASQALRRAVRFELDAALQPQALAVQGSRGPAFALGPSQR